ncbi:NAD(+) diphosphatase [Paludibacterium yongneupense]|uniref:NAD(+) diphosphatase n=1 Tax=Paludibacterium yongneupense TaxID=400061 RepID=UPI00041B5069|nr:NAD(+) diphosphatase [Paludibacterium yongneupense]
MSFIITPTPVAGAPVIWLIWNGDKVLLRAGTLPTQRDALALTATRFIGMAGEHACFSGEIVGAPPADAHWLGLREALLLHDFPMQQALSRARLLTLFDRQHRFCGACAAPLLDNGHDMGKRCPHCDTLYYPKVSPAMMVLIVRGRELLLARGPHFAEGVYSALAGFVEAGETLEQCVHREAHEEVGVHIESLRYAGSQQWPFPHSLMLAFTADYAGGEVVAQEEEIEDARWFDIDALPPLPSKISLAHWLITRTAERIRAATGR